MWVRPSEWGDMLRFGINGSKFYVKVSKAIFKQFLTIFNSFTVNLISDSCQEKIKKIFGGDDSNFFVAFVAEKVNDFINYTRLVLIGSKLKTGGASVH